MKIDALLLLAEYFSMRKDISFCLMYEDENAGRKVRNFALFVDTARGLAKADPAAICREIELEIGIMEKRKDIGVVCLNKIDESVRHRIIETSTPVFCRDERQMKDYCRRIYNEDVSHQKLFNFKNLTGTGLLLVL